MAEAEVKTHLEESLASKTLVGWLVVWFEFHVYDGYIGFDSFQMKRNDSIVLDIEDGEILTDMTNTLHSMYRVKPQTTEFRWNKGRFTLRADGTYQMEYLWDQADYDERMQYTVEEDESAANQLPSNWQAIDQRLQQLYPDREPDETYGTLISYQFGGPDPLGRVKVYFNEDAPVPHYHYRTYGFSDVHSDDHIETSASTGLGFELSFRLVPFVSDFQNPVWPVGLLQWLARYVLQTGNTFKEYDWVPLNEPLRRDSGTILTGLVFVADPKLGLRQAEVGSIQILQVVGLTQQEITAIQEKRQKAEAIVLALRGDNPLLIIDLKRK